MSPVTRSSSTTEASAAVARLHGGTLTLADNKPGLQVAIDLPAVPAAE